MRILFPCEYKNIKKVDNNFELEYNACQTLGIDTALFDHDTFVSEQKLITNLKKVETLILRGWMLNSTQYKILYKKLLDTYNSILINNHLQYLHCHYFPNVFHDICEYSPSVEVIAYEKEINDDLLEIIHSNIHSDMIIKDFVKSEKGTNLFKIPSNISFEDFKKFVYDFIEARKPLFNEGIVLKKWINLKKDGIGNTNEWRAFFYRGELISLEQNSNYLNTISPEPNFVCEVARNITRSNFFTIDFALTENNLWVVLECGDGQVSGLALKENEIEFYQRLNQHRSRLLK